MLLVRVVLLCGRLIFMFNVLKVILNGYSFRFWIGFVSCWWFELFVLDWLVCC